MKKITSTSIFSIVILLFLTSCAAFHSGYMSNSASLGAANFSYVKQNIKGEDTASYFFGIGGMAKETLVNNAKQKMIASNPLSSNQALANITVNFKSSFILGIFYTVRCIVTADIVEFK